MKPARLLIALGLMLSAFFSAPPSRAADDFRELRGDHFIVRFQADETFAREVMHRSERLYASILRNLGHDQLKEPWRGDRRCTIILFRDQASFQKKAEGVQWAEGMANYKTREIFAYNGNPQFMPSVLPHELTHMLFRESTGSFKVFPLWLDEGVALSQEDAKRDELYRAAAKAFQNGSSIPFRDMAGVRDARAMDSAQAQIFYAQSLATVNFLKDSFPKDKFLKFCRLIGEGTKAEDALKRVYGGDRIQSLQDLQKRVQQYLQ